MEQTVQRKAKRKLSQLDFSGKESHIALVHRDQGGPASGAAYKLVLKANNFTEEYIQKMQQVKVTLELPEFLERFFYVYEDDAELLARMMGYVEPIDTGTHDMGGYEMSNAEMDKPYEDYIQSRLEAFEIIKSVNDAESISDVLSTLDETQYLSLLNDQALIEKSLFKIEKSKKEQLSVNTEVTKSESVNADNDTSTPASVEKVEAVASEVTKSKETQMTKTIKTEDVEVAVEMIEKSAVVSIQKALDEQKEQLTKALEIIAVFEQDKKELVIKSKTAQFSVVKDLKLQAPIVKAALSLESDDDFDAFLAAITSMMANIQTSQEFMEKSALFTELGAAVSDETAVKESAVARILKAKQTK
jgi:hypothetical protein